ncbi:hypothetical protein [Nocardia sp. NPDC051570]|uniref:hypothetical protein n=1 Tax=Nocardia sp. NPDC051570 TaxID=3364324 RepID=UPI0037B208C5
MSGHSGGFEDASATNELPYDEWNPMEIAKFEVALEAIGLAIAAYSSRIWAEEHKDDPDPAAIAALTAAQGDLARVRRELKSTDRAQIADVLARYPKLADDIEAGRI